MLFFYDRRAFDPPGPSVTPKPLSFTLPPPPRLQCPPAARSQFRMSEMNTASPRIPSPLDTAGMMAVVSAPGLAGQGTQQRGLASGDRAERTPGSAKEPSRPRGGLAGWRAGWQAVAPPLAPPLRPASGALSLPLVWAPAAHTRVSPHFLSHWPLSKGTTLPLVHCSAISVWE